MQNKIADVSVIIPCYDCKETIQRALNSVLNQSVQPREIILVDDASRDGTIELLTSEVNKRPDILKLIKLDKNLGAGVARNTAWEKASGYYVAFLDSDDSWHPDKLAVQYKWMLENPRAMMSGHKIREGHNFSEINAGPVRHERLTLRKLLISNPLSTPTVMVQNQAKDRFPNARYAEDYELWLRLVYGAECYKLDTCLALIHKAAYGSSGLSANLLQMEKGVQLVLKKLYKDNIINFLLFYSSSVFSWLKFIRRLLVLKLR